MKKTLLITAVMIMIAVACKTKKAVYITPSSEEMTSTAHLTSVQARFPDATTQELEKGYAVYTGPCTKCHKPKDLTVYTEPKLLKILDKMAKRAHLAPGDKQAVIRFAIGVRATSPSK